MNNLIKISMIHKLTAILDASSISVIALLSEAVSPSSVIILAVS